MATSTVSNRPDAERDVISELQAWRRYAVPESAPLDAEDVARLVRACFDALGIDAEVGADFSINTVHYYRRKHILDEPTGRTSAARYGIRHLWQAVEIYARSGWVRKDAANGQAASHTPDEGGPGKKAAGKSAGGPESAGDN